MNAVRLAVTGESQSLLEIGFVKMSSEDAPDSSHR